MIFSARVSHVGSLHVANVLLLKDFAPPLGERAITLFRDFDEAFLKVRSDVDATRIYGPEDLADQRLMELHTATQSALRAIHRQAKVAGEFYTLGLDRDPGASEGRGPLPRSLWSNLPAWTTTYVEKTTGEFQEIRAVNPAGGPATGWRRWAVDADDLFVHVGFFGATPRAGLHAINRDSHPFFAARLGGLVESGAFPTLTLRLQAPEW